MEAPEASESVECGRLACRSRLVAVSVERQEYGCVEAWLSDRDLDRDRSPSCCSGALACLGCGCCTPGVSGSCFRVSTSGGADAGRCRDLSCRRSSVARPRSVLRDLTDSGVVDRLGCGGGVAGLFCRCCCMSPPPGPCGGGGGSLGVMVESCSSRRGCFGVGVSTSGLSTLVSCTTSSMWVSSGPPMCGTRSCCRM